MHDRVAVNQVCSTAANTKVFYSIDGCLFYLWVIGKPQVVVAAEADNVFVIDLHLDLLRAFSYPARTITMLLFSFFECFFEIFQLKIGSISAGACRLFTCFFKYVFGVQA